jgi:hypothetical protein
MVGYADLDEHGSWQTYPEYGAVWFPTTVAPGWAPYSDGYWTDVGGWGPTWVDRAPWGYAPFHYGRWAWIGGRWGWCPGGYVARPLWAPALVAWVGGPGWGLSVRQGAPVYGWVPLGWGDAYHPNWRRCSYNCWAHYNRPYAVNVTVRPTAPPARYANVAVPGAISAVAAPALVGRRPVGTNLVNVPISLATSAPVMASAPPVAQAPRPAPRAGAGGPSPPPGASTHVRAPRPEPSGQGTVSRPTTPVTQSPGSAPGTPSGGAGSSGTPSPVAPVARPGPGSNPNASPSGTSTARTRGDAVAPKAPPAGTAPQPGLATPPVQVQAPPVSSPGVSGTLAPAPRESPRPQPSQSPRPRENPAPPVASQPVPAGAGLSPSVAPRPVPYAAPPVRGAPAAAPGLPGAAGVVAPAVAPAAAIPAPQATGQAAPVVPANARGGRAAEKSVPDAPPTGTGAVK